MTSTNTNSLEPENIKTNKEDDWGNNDITTNSIPAFSFPEIWHYAQIYRILRFEKMQNIPLLLSNYYREFKVIEIKATRNRYLIGTSPDSQSQEILIRGTANFRNALQDLEYTKVYDKKLGINLHKGFRKTAWAVYRDIQQYLKPGYKIYISGQSLGAAEALILAFYLIEDGYDVVKVIDFGQPKVTDWQGVQKYQKLNLLRIVDENDLVPLVPPSTVRYRNNPYRHLGPELILLDGPYYCLLDEKRGEDKKVTDFQNILKLQGYKQEIQEHLFPSYLKRLQDKLTNAILVPYADREKYIAVSQVKNKK